MSVLGVSRDHMYLSVGNDWDNRTIIKSKEELLEALLKKDTIEMLMFSSSIDYAEEETDEEWILDVCSKLMGLTEDENNDV